MKDVSLSHVFLERSEFETREIGDASNLQVAYFVRTKNGRDNVGGLRAWVQYVVFALPDEVSSRLSDSMIDLTPELVDELFVWKIEMNWISQYVGEPKAVNSFADQDLEAFALVMGPPTVHPYARELAQSITSRSAYPAFTMGLLTPITALPDDELVQIQPEGE